MTFFLLIALVLASATGQDATKSTSAIALSGSWRDARGGSWTISQNGSEVTIANSEGVTMRGKLDGRTIKYTEHIIPGETSSQACHPYVGQPIEFAAKFKISTDATKMERKTPESATKGQCSLNIKKMPRFALTKISGN